MDALETPKREVAVVGTVNLDTVIGAALVGPGGKGANQAVAAARHGARTALVGCVGDDPAADEILAVLGAEPGLDVSAVARVPGPTGRATIAFAAGEHTIERVRGANAALDEEHVHRHGSLIASAAVLCTQLGVPVDAVRAALEIAHSVGTLTILDPCPPDVLSDDVLRTVDVCTPNETEAERLTGVVIDPDDHDAVRRAARVLLDRGCGAVIVTLGARGAYLASVAGDDVLVPSIPVTAVDPTGAGDALCGVLAARLATGASLHAALVPAVVAGALAVTRPGAVGAMPTRAEVEQRIG